jgi:hypothetical protein
MGVSLSVSKLEKSGKKLGTGYSVLAAHFFLTFAPIRNSFLTVPVGRLFI